MPPVNRGNEFFLRAAPHRRPGLRIGLIVHLRATQAGSNITVTVTVTVSGAEPRDFVTVMPKDTRAGGYDAYQYAGSTGVLKLRVPAKPGEYEISLLGANPPYSTLAWRALALEAAAATLDAPAQVAAGARFLVGWTGPNNEGDYVGIGDVDPKSQPHISYMYAAKGSTLTLSAPDKPGNYELRFLATGGATILYGPCPVATPCASRASPRVRKR